MNTASIFVVNSQLLYSTAYTYRKCNQRWVLQCVWVQFIWYSLFWNWR